MKADAPGSGSDRRSRSAAHVIDAGELARAVEILSAGGLIGLASGRFTLSQIAVPVGVGIGVGTGVPIVTSVVTAVI